MKKILILFFIALQSIFGEPGAFVKDIQIDDLKIQFPKIDRETLNKNIEMYSIFSDNFPILYLSISIYAGKNSTAPKSPEIPEILTDFITFGGSTKYPNEQLFAKLESLGAKLKISSDLDSMSINVSCLSRDQAEVLEIIEDLIQNPTFNDTALEKAKKDLYESINRRNDKPDSIGFRKTKEMLFHGFIAGKSPQVDSINKITKEELIAFWKENIKYKKKAVLITGNFDKNNLKQFLTRVLPYEEKDKSKFKEEIMTSEMLVKNLKTKKFKNLFINKEVNQSMVMMSGVIPQHNHPDFFALQILNYIIGGGGFNSYMMQRIREERGLAYSAYSYPIISKDYGVIYFYSMTKNQSIKEVHNLMKEILSEKTFNSITEEELVNAKNAIINQFVFNFTNNFEILADQLRFDEDGMPPNYMQTFRESIQSVTLGDVRRIGKNYFSYSNLKTTIVAPEKVTQKLGIEGYILEIKNPEDEVK